MSYKNRKNPRLKDYDYSTPWTYFITICSSNRLKIFSKIIVNTENSTAENHLSKFGLIAQQQIELLKTQYEGIIIDNYVVMPNHIHILLSTYELQEKSNVSISDIVCTFKSKTTIICHANGFKKSDVFQSSYHDRIVRNKLEYEKIFKYIDENPLRWNRDVFF